jgi:transcriptional regulator with XRE-family HTH domain
MSFGDNVKRLRTIRKLTQSELAEKSGITFGQISKIERGDVDPRLSTIQSLLSALECSANDLITGGDGEDQRISEFLSEAFNRANDLPEYDKDVIVHLCTALLRVNDQRRIFDLKARPDEVEDDERYLHHLKSEHDAAKLEAWQEKQAEGGN